MGEKIEHPKLDIEKVFLTPRFKVVATYPEMKEKLGEIICPSTIDRAKEYMDHPAIFQPIEWWHDRSMCTLMNIRYIEVLTRGYYTIGDRIKVHHFIFEKLNTLNPIVVGFAASYQDRPPETFKLTECRPATEERLMK